MRKTIRSMASGVRVSRYAYPQGNLSGRDGAFMGRTDDAPNLVFIWAYTLEGNTPVFASRMAVKEYVPGDNTPWPYVVRPTLADIVTYDQQTERIIVPAGPVGIARAVARWIKENS